MDKTVKLTEMELDELHKTTISMYSKLKRDKHVAPADLDFWYRLQDKLLMAKIKD